MADTKPDFMIRDEGTIILLYPRTAAAKAWAQEHIGQDNGYQPDWPGRIIIEHRYFVAILDGFQADGLSVEVA